MSFFKSERVEELAQFDPTDEDVPGEEDDQQRFLTAQWRELAYRNFERLRDADTDAAQSAGDSEIEAYSYDVCGGFATGVQLPARQSAPLGMLIAKRTEACQNGTS